MSRGRFPEFGTCACKTKCPPGHYSAREGVGIVGAPLIVPEVGSGMVTPVPSVLLLGAVVCPTGAGVSRDGFTPPGRAVTPHFQSGEARGSAYGVPEDFG